MKVEISNHAIFLNVNKPSLGDLIEQSLTIKGCHGSRESVPK